MDNDTDNGTDGGTDDDTDSGTDDGTDDGNIQTLLVIRLGALGDVANTIPAVAALRRGLPDVRIVWLAEEVSAELVDATKIADDVIVFPRRTLAPLWKRPWRWPAALSESRRFLKRLREHKYACALDFQGNLKSGVLGALSWARDRIGFARGASREMNWLFNNILAAPASLRMLRAEKNAALAQVLLPDLDLADVEIPADPAAAAMVERFLEGLNGSGPLVVMHPGVSGFGRFKRWPAERYGLLAQRLAERGGCRCVLTHGPGEKALAEEAAAASSGAAAVAPPLNINELIELLRRADLVIASDTGPLHIAALLKRPLVAIYGPKDPAIYAPYGTQCELVRLDLPCSPCTKRSCEHVECMMGIEVEDVAKAARKMLTTF
jgi:lipopolysaccharide heptosyltransferase II